MAAMFADAPMGVRFPPSVAPLSRPCLLYTSSFEARRRSGDDVQEVYHDADLPDEEEEE